MGYRAGASLLDYDVLRFVISFTVSFFLQLNPAISEEILDVVIIKKVVGNLV
jgi:hypothetical protein